jgi:inorganic pyrophosphatase/exopolyphosphatase
MNRLAVLLRLWQEDFVKEVCSPKLPVALCLCAGLVSDTLNLTSPTTTDVDRDMLVWLSELAGVDADEFAEAFFASGSFASACRCAGDRGD